VTPRTIAFTDHGTTLHAANDGGPVVIVAADAATRGTLARLYPGASSDPDRVYIAVFQGEQRTGGYAVRIEVIERSGATLTIRSTFSEPPRDALTIQVITSPAHLVSVAADAISGVGDAVVVDQSGAERARVTVPQSAR
jgi:hypothetical protein